MKQIARYENGSLYRKWIMHTRLLSCGTEKNGFASNRANRWLIIKLGTPAQRSGTTNAYMHIIINSLSYLILKDNKLTRDIQQ